MNIPEQWTNSITEGTFPHAILLCGAENGGQLELARKIAALYCNGTADEALLRDNPLYLELSPMKVKELRETLTAFCMLGNSDGKHCLVLTDVHQFNKENQNALLKTIEEPPVDTLFIIVGNEMALLPTIRSRCTILRIGSQPPKKIESMLIAEGHDPDRARLASLLSDGILETARRFAADEYMQFRRTAIEFFDRTLFGVTPFLELSKHVSSSDEDGKKKVSPAACKELLDIWLSILRDALVAGIDSGRIINLDSRNIVNKIAAHFTISKIQCIIGVILEAERMQTYQTNASMILDWVVAQCKG